MIRVIKQYGVSILLLIVAIFCLFNISKSIQDAFTVITNSLALLLAVVYFVNFEKENLVKIKGFVLNIKWPFHGKAKKILTNTLNLIIKKRWDIISYLFLFLLLLITLGQFSYLENFIDLAWINKYQVIITVLTILSGGLTFWHNRDRVEKEIDKEQIDEQIVEDKRKTEFASKFPRINKIPVVRNFIKWAYTECKIYILLLTLFIISGFIIRFLCAIWGNINLDEGIHLYDAKLITEGFIPFRDYLTREPYYIYFLSFFVKIFGPELLTSRLLSVVASTLTIPIIYILGKNIFQKKIGLIAAAIFSLSPFIIYETHLGNLYGVYPFILGLVFLSFSNLIKKPNNKKALIAGFLLGLAVHFYRLTVFYFPIIGLILGIILVQKKIKKNNIGLFCLSIIIPFFTPIIYFSSLSSYNNFEIIYGTNELIVAFFSIFIGLLAGIILYKFWGKYKKRRQIVSFCLLFFLIIFSIYSFLNIGIQSNYKAKIMFDAFLGSWHLIFLVLIALIIYLKKILFTNAKISLILKLIILGLIFYLTFYGATTAKTLQNFGSRIIPITLTNFFLLYYSLSIIFIFFLNKKINFKSLNFKNDQLYWWLLLFAPAAFYLIHVQLFSNIFLSFIILGCVMAAMGLYYLIEITKRSSLITKTSLLVILASFFVVPVYLNSTTTLRDRMWPQRARNEIGNYIKENTQENEEIFTNAIIFVVENNRRIALDLSRSTIYTDNPVYMPDYIGTAKNLIPSLQLAEYIKNNINLILIDNRTASLFKNNSDFTDIKQYYYLDRKWPEYEIEAWKKIK